MPRPDRLFVLTVGVQWLVTVAVALWATRSGSVYGDPEAARAAIAAAHGVAGGTLPTTGGPLFALLLAPLARLTTNLNTVSTVVTAVDIVLLAPLASYCLLELGRRIAGRRFAALAAAVWLFAPILGVIFIVSKYRDVYVNDVLPVVYGLSVQPVYLAMVLSLVAALFAVRAVAGAPRTALVAGLGAGAAIASFPMAAGVAGGVLLALAAARRWRGLGEAVIGLGAAAVPTLVWRYRASGTPSITLGHPTWTRFQAAMANVREFTWSNRALQWLPIAGAIGMFRLMRPAAVLLAAWVAIPAVIWVSTLPTFDRGVFFIGLIPAWPAYALLVAAIPALVPTLVIRLGQRLERDQSEPPGVSRSTAIVLLVVVVLGAGLALLVGR